MWSEEKISDCDYNSSVLVKFHVFESVMWYFGDVMESSSL